MKYQYGFNTVLSILLLLFALASPARSVEWRKGTVKFSSGRTVKGKVYILRNKLYVYDLSAQDRRNISVDNVKRIETLVRDEKMARKWFFKESGSDEKIYTGKRYPVRRFYVRITFHDGSTLRGPPIGRTIYVQTDDGRENYKLTKKQEGKVGEKLKDLVYVKSITFGGEGPGVTGSIVAAFRPSSGEHIQRAVALNTEQNFLRQGKRDGQKVKFSQCTTGTYDLLVATNKAFYAAFSAEGRESQKRLNSRQVADVQNWINKLEDFYTKQRVLYGAGTREKAFMLVFRERSGNIHGSAKLMRRYDVWVMEKQRKQWVINTRNNRIGIFRMTSEKEQVPRRELVVLPALAGHRIGPEHKTRTLDIKLDKDGVEPIPEAEGDEPGWPKNDSSDGRNRS